MRLLLRLAGEPFVYRLVRSLEGAVDGRRRRLEHRSGLPGSEAEDVAEDQHRPLAWRQVLECRDEGEFDTFALLIAGVRTGWALETEARVRVRLKPDGVVHRGPSCDVRIGRGCVVHRQHPLWPSLDRAQAGVGRDPVQPRAERASPFEPGKAAPGPEQGLL